MSDNSPPRTPHHSFGARVRRYLPATLVVLATLLAIVGSLTVWVQRQALDEDAWADASRELIQDPEVRTAVSSYLVDELFTAVDVPAELSTRLPPRAQPLAPLLATQLADVAQNVTEDILARPRVQERWVQLNRVAHRTFMNVIEEREDARITASGDQVVLNLRPLLVQVAGRLGLEDRVPADAGMIVVAESDQISTFRRAVNAIEKLSVLLWLIVVGMYAAAVALAVGRRRVMLAASGAGLVVAGLVVLLARRLAGDWIVDTLAGDTANRTAGVNAWLIGTNLARDVAIALIAYGVLVMLGAWLAGVSGWARSARRHAAPVLRRHPQAVGVGLGAVVLVVLLAGPGAEGRRLLATVVLCGLLIAGIVVLWKQTLREYPEQPAT